MDWGIVCVLLGYTGKKYISYRHIGIHEGTEHAAEERANNDTHKAYTHMIYADHRPIYRRDRLPYPHRATGWLVTLAQALVQRWAPPSG